ncbi:MAG: 16S rRNA (guanine(527)-N(7))-methyltransferase RsmG [Proteobacteria bacterium]|nr:16S rRNA (guanine(527)-N(7))-methyltransferase RsmG [Pseudomonadota bacterium]
MKDLDGFGAEAFQEAVGASDRALSDLVRYRALLEAGSVRMNLVGPSALDAFWRRHAYDSAQLCALEPAALQWLDVGSGAGLPGIVLAILGRDRPGMTVQLVESMEKRCAFLRAVVDELSLPARVVPGRIEALPSPRVEVVTARAVAPLPRLLDHTQAVLKGAVGLFLKGRRVQEEIEEALQSWRFDYALAPSLSDPEGRILRIWSVRRASA